MMITSFIPILVIMIQMDTSASFSVVPQSRITKLMDMSDQWTSALRAHDKLKVAILLSKPYDFADGAYNKSLIVEELLIQIRSYYQQILSNETYVDHVGAFEKLYTFYADSMFLLPPSETVFAIKWFTVRLNYSITPVSAASFGHFDAANGNMTLVQRELSRIQEFVKHALPVLHDLGHTERDTQRLKQIAAHFVAISQVTHPSDLCIHAKASIFNFYETWSTEK